MTPHALSELIREQRPIVRPLGRPRGQNVNKVATKAAARLPLSSLSFLTEEGRGMLETRLANRINADGEIVVAVQDTREQARNREIAVDRLSDLVSMALRRPRRRVKTRPSRASRGGAPPRQAAVQRQRRPPYRGPGLTWKSCGSAPRGECRASPLMTIWSLRVKRDSRVLRPGCRPRRGSAPGSCASAWTSWASADCPAVDNRRGCAAHARSFEEQYRRAGEVAPLFVNSHTGRDVFPLVENLAVFQKAGKLEAEVGIPVVHETHRGRPGLLCPPQWRSWMPPRRCGSRRISPTGAAFTSPSWTTWGRRWPGQFP